MGVHGRLCCVALLVGLRPQMALFCHGMTACDVPFFVSVVARHVCLWMSVVGHRSCVQELVLSPCQASSFLLCKFSTGGILQGRAELSRKFFKDFGVQLRRKPNSQGQGLKNYRPNLAFACLLLAALLAT